MSPITRILLRSVVCGAAVALYVAAIVLLLAAFDRSSVQALAKMPWTLLFGQVLIGGGLAALICAHYQACRYFQWHPFWSGLAAGLVFGLVFCHALAPYVLEMQPHTGLVLLGLQAMAVSAAVCVGYLIPNRRLDAVIGTAKRPQSVENAS